MKISKGKIILIIIVIYFSIFALININKEKEINKEILNKVNYVTDGKIDPKNENKLVLVSGKITTDNLVTFLELEDFKTIKIKRKVEDYIKEYNEEKNNYQYKWVERFNPVENQEDYLHKITCEEKVSNIKIGEYNLDDKGLNLIPTDKYYTKQETIGELITKGIDYSRDPYEEDLKEGDMKITYKYYDLENNPYLSILAIQKGNSFSAYKVDKNTEVYQVFVGRIDNKTKLKKQLKLNVKKTTKGKILFIIMIVIVGIFFIVDNKKNNK